MANFYHLDRTVRKDVHGFDCFQVIMEDPNDKSARIKMFVTEQLPNLPTHFPLMSNVLNAEPLEINIVIMGMQVKIGVLKAESNVDIEKALNVKFNEAKKISDTEYLRMQMD